jgi:hypothetical protein
MKQRLRRRTNVEAHGVDRDGESEQFELIGAHFGRKFRGAQHGRKKLRVVSPDAGRGR